MAARAELISQIGLDEVIGVSVRDMVIAALKVLREPSEDMRYAGAFARKNRKPVAEIWQAMIDVLIGEHI